MEPDHNNNCPLVVIGVATHKRPRYLRDLLESMRKIEVDEFRARLIVADNDAAESARPIVEEFTETFPIPISYIVEPTRGIASARNRLVHEANKLGAEFIAFVDDDTVVEPGWLRELVRVARTMPVAAVVGVMGEYLFEPGVPEWVKQSNYWRPGPMVRTASNTTGSRVRSFATTNLLLRLDALKEIPGPFDVRCNLTGGSDTVLSIQLNRRGLQAVLCAESIVHERVPASRANASWMIRRGWRNGVNRAFIFREYEPTLRGKLACILGTLRVAKHAPLLVVAARRGRAGIIPCLSNLAVGCGFLAGLLGIRYEEYRVTHGK